MKIYEQKWTHIAQIIEHLLVVEVWFWTLAAFNNWHEGGCFYLIVLFGSDFVSWFFIENFEKNLKMKIGINWVNLTLCHTHWVLQKMPLGGAKDEHFFLFSYLMPMKVNDMACCAYIFCSKSWDDYLH